MRVQVYTTTYCAFCVRAKSLLTKREIPFEEIDVTNDPDKREWLVTKTGKKTVPQIFIDGDAVGGSDDLAAMDRSGELARRLALPTPAL